MFGWSLDVAGLTDEELSVALRDASDAVNAAEARRLVVAAEWDRRRAWGADGAYSGRCWVADRCTLSRAGAGSVLRTAQVVASVPLVAAAVTEGSLPVSRAEVLVAVVTKRTAAAFVRDQEMLLGHAARLPIDELAKLARFWQRTVDEDGAEPVVPEEQVRVTKVDDGTVHVKGVLGAEDGAVFTNVLEGLAGQLWRARRAGTGNERERPPVVGHHGRTDVDNLTLLCSHHHQVHDHGWNLERLGDGGLAFTGPDGRVLTRPPPPPPWPLRPPPPRIDPTDRAAILERVHALTRERAA